MSEVDIPFTVLRDQINSAVDVIVQLQRTADGTRRVVDVSYVTSRRREEYRLAPILAFDPEARDGGTAGAFVRAPLPAAMAERLRQRGEALPDGFTVAEPVRPAASHVAPSPVDPSPVAPSYVAPSYVVPTHGAGPSEQESRWPS
jgi:pilus assembly protein CpaF